MDGLNGEIITYRINDTPNDTTRLNTFKDLILHSDQGFVYTSLCFQKLVKKMI